jgi:hypothetical protein
MNKKLTITAIGIVSIASLGAMTDAQINPYHDTGEEYRMEIADTKIQMMKSEPKVVISKWNDEATLAISHKAVKGRGNRPLLSNRIEWKQGSTEVHAYPLSGENVVQAAEGDVNGIEFEVVWNEQPETTMLQFEFDGWENYDFFLQPPLSEEQVAKGYYQPENVPYSFAVYHKTKRDHILGETNYETGKFGHIYRLKAIDAEGNEKWIDDVSFINGVLTATVDPVWAENAVYPVTVDPTFGTTACGANLTGSAYTNTNYIELSANSPTGTNTLTNLSLCYTPTTSGGTVRFGLYSDAGADDPVNRLVVDAATWTFGATTKQFYTNPVAFNYALSASTKYWGAEKNSNSEFWYDVTAGVDLYYETADLPATAGGTKEATIAGAMYATYTAASADPSYSCSALVCINAPVVINAPVGIGTTIEQASGNVPISVANLTANTGTSDPQLTGSISPAADSVIYLTIGMSFSGSVPPDSLTISNVCTWTKLGTETFASRRRVWLYRGTSCSGSGQVSIEQTGVGTVQEVGWVIDQALGLNAVTPDSGLTVDTAGGSGVTSRTVTVGGTPGAGDATYASQVLENNIDMTVEAGWAALGQTTTGSLGVRRVESGWDDAADQSMAWTWGGTSQGTAGFALILED